MVTETKFRNSSPVEEPDSGRMPRRNRMLVLHGFFTYMGLGFGVQGLRFRV